MGYTDLPFVPAVLNGQSTDDRLYCSHAEVLHPLLLHACPLSPCSPSVHMQVQAYLEAYADRFDLRQHIQFSSPVTSVEPLPQQSTSGQQGWPRWAVTVQPASQVSTLAAALREQAAGPRHISVEPRPQLKASSRPVSQQQHCCAGSSHLPHSTLIRCLCCRASRPHAWCATLSWSATATTASRACLTCRAGTASPAASCTATTTARGRLLLGSAWWLLERSRRASTSAARLPRAPSRQAARMLQ